MIVGSSGENDFGYSFDYSTWFTAVGDVRDALVPGIGQSKLKAAHLYGMIVLQSSETSGLCLSKEYVDYI